MSKKQQQTDDRIEFENYKTLGAELFTALKDQWLDGTSVLKHERLVVDCVYKNQEDFVRKVGIDYIFQATASRPSDQAVEDLLPYLQWDIVVEDATNDVCECGGQYFVKMGKTIVSLLVQPRDSE